MTYSMVKYFDARAPRYSAALKACPGARVLDVLPYIVAMASRERMPGRSRIRICDAFGGTGFLSQALENLPATFVVCDASSEMLRGAALHLNSETFVTTNDFEDAVESFGEGSFDFVFSHGGLHHVAETTDAKSIERSRGRQLEIVARLARLVAPGGALVIADIPEGRPVEREGIASRTRIERGNLRRVMGRVQFDTLMNALPRLPAEVSLRDVRQLVCDLTTVMPFEVPRFFFDHFVRWNTPMGHEAVYPRFEDFDEVATLQDLRLDMRINYQGPWLFTSESEAGWFFREKFSIADVAPLGGDPITEQEMFSALCQFLGGATGAMTTVNWGVTYATYVRER